eukprot:3757651-Rhodomonas_salina.2
MDEFAHENNRTAIRYHSSYGLSYELPTPRPRADCNNYKLLPLSFLRKVLTFPKWYQGVAGLHGGRLRGAASGHGLRSQVPAHHSRGVLDAGEREGRGQREAAHCRGTLHPRARDRVH